MQSRWLITPLSAGSYHKWERLVDRLALLMLCVYVAECTVGGGGRWLVFGNVSIRMVLFTICFVLTLPRVVRHLWQLVRYPYIWLLLLFALWIAFEALLGLQSGNRISFICGDVFGLTAFALLPGFLVTIHDRRRVELLLDVIFYAAATLAAVTTLLHFLLAFLSPETIRGLDQILNTLYLGNLSTTPTGVERIDLRSQVFLLVALLLGIRKIYSGGAKRHVPAWICSGLMVFAAALTYSRSFWFGMAAAFVLFAVLFRRYWTRWLAWVGVMAVALWALMGVSWAVYGSPCAAVELLERVDHNLIVLMPADQLPPDELVAEEAFAKATVLNNETLEEQLQRIGERPVFGWGLGSNLDDIRQDGKTDYTYFDLMMKTGVIGLLMFLLLLCWHGIQLGAYTLRRVRRRANCYEFTSPYGTAWTLVCGLFGVAVAAAFTPMLTSPMGIAGISLAAATVNVALQPKTSTMVTARTTTVTLSDGVPEPTMEIRTADILRGMHAHKAAEQPSSEIDENENSGKEGS